MLLEVVRPQRQVHGVHAVHAALRSRARPTGAGWYDPGHEFRASFLQKSKKLLKCIQVCPDAAVLPS